MNPTTLTLVLCLVASLYSTADGQLASWSPQQLQQLLQPAAQQQVPQSLQFNPALGMQLASPGAEPQRQLTAPDLQNQIQALGAQLAAANRQIQFYEQKLASQQQPAAGIESAPLNQPLGVQSQSQQQLPQLQQQLQQQMQLQAALAAQQQQLALQQQQQPQQFSPFGGQQVAAQPQAQQQQPQTAQFPSAPPRFQPAQPAVQQQAQVSSLVDNSANNQLASDPRLAGQPQFFSNQQAQQSQQLQLQLQQQQQLQLQQQQQQQPTTSSSVEPASIEPSLAAQQPTAPTSSQQPARNDDKFSIGLGVLSPGYTQKFGNTELDFNQDKNGFSYTLSNNGHRNEPPPTPTTQKPATASADS